MYKEYSPHILLTPYIDKYWISKTNVESGQQMLIAADGCVDIIFYTKASATSHQIEE